MTRLKKISEIKHPKYISDASNFAKYRLTYEGGKAFVNKYLEKFTLREDNTDFSQRKAISYCPAHAKAAIMDIKNAIFQRMADIVRRDGTPSFMSTINGNDGGVTRLGDTMTSFMGNMVLPELLVMGKVGVYVDNGIIPPDATLLDVKGINPYLYIYPAEQILSWAVDVYGNLKTLLLKDYDYSEDSYGLVSKQETYYRLYARESAEEVSFRMFDAEGHELTMYNETLNLPQIPFVVGQLSHSLLIDVCDYQIALLNLASSDMNYALKANFPFYIEQYDARIDALMNTFKTAAAAAGVSAIGENDTEANEVHAKAEDRENVKVGHSQGRRYPKDVDPPSFIHPSPEPLKASMEKQEELKQDIRILVNLALTSVKKRDGSAESKKYDERGLEAGLSYVGMVLEKMERQIAYIWESYEEADNKTVVKYPKKYDLKSDAEQRKEADELSDLLTKVPSKSFQKDVSKRIATITMGDKVSSERISVYEAEIDKAEVIITDPEIIQQDHESGFVSTEFASILRGYPKGQVEQAKEDHAERLKRINIAQTLGDGKNARGITDAGEEDESKNEKVKAAADAADKE